LIQPHEVAFHVAQVLKHAHGALFRVRRVTEPVCDTEHKLLAIGLAFEPDRPGAPPHAPPPQHGGSVTRDFDTSSAGLIGERQRGRMWECRELFDLVSDFERELATSYDRRA
jgi:hypothetical protein